MTRDDPPAARLLAPPRRRASASSSVRAICARTVDTLARRRARGARITIATELGDDPLLVSADEHQIQQALANLIVNAMQAMPDGGRIDVTIGGRRAPSARRGAPPRATSSASPSPTTGRASRRSTCRASSSRSSPPRSPARAPASGSRSRTASCAITAAGSRSRASSARGSRFTICLPAAAEAQSPPHRAA